MRYIFFSSILILLLCFVAIFLFLWLSPQFGQSPSEKLSSAYIHSPNFRHGRFIQRTPLLTSKFSWKIFWEIVQKQFTKNPYDRPQKNIETCHIDADDLSSYHFRYPRIFWFGHSALLIQIEEKNILIDPMFGQYASPIPWKRMKRYSKKLPIEIESLPQIDVVIFSHDHYDHLDYGSIKKLKDKVHQFYTPLGLGSHLKAWGVDEHKIQELDWWDSINYKGITFFCTPANHSSGRGLFDRSKTLWCSWVVLGKKNNFFFSGDGGYGNHFTEIRKKFGSFDLALLECGQYNKSWKYVHMSPEETAQAGKDLEAKLILPIHWGAFTLAKHDWFEPIERLLVKAKSMNIQVTSPPIGVPVLLAPDSLYPTARWWEKYK